MALYTSVGSHHDYCLFTIKEAPKIFADFNFDGVKVAKEWRYRDWYSFLEANEIKPVCIDDTGTAYYVFDQELHKVVNYQF